ncbi:MAG: hypothetical protein HDP34_04135 [Clostridia bacterium]|nr:hypothetical protein [Clostridia bacterium]
MLCQHCKKNAATVNYVEIINGDKFESHLCAHCYAELYGELNSKANADIWAGLFGSSAPRKKVCPVCGTSYSDYERTGLLGCASCYDVFKEELIPSIRRIQGKVEHVGKIGKNNDEFGLHRRLKTLQEELEVALREKRYVDAGRLNKRIDEISKSLHGGEKDD